MRTSDVRMRISRCMHVASAVFGSNQMTQLSADSGTHTHISTCRKVCCPLAASNITPVWAAVYAHRLLCPSTDRLTRQLCRSLDMPRTEDRLCGRWMAP